MHLKTMPAYATILSHFWETDAAHFLAQEATIKVSPVPS